MASPVEVARTEAGFDDGAIEHMQRLFRSWGLLADLGMGDALLLAPVIDQPDEFVVLANVRPSTAQTLYGHDPLGDRHRSSKRPLVSKAWTSGEVARGQVKLGPHFPAGLADIAAAPFSVDGRRIGVVLRERRIREGALQQLERTYVELAERLTDMIRDEIYPFMGANEPEYRTPRVGDGLLVLDMERRVTFQSPNAVSAMHRLGSVRTPLRRRLTDIGLDDSFARTAYALRTAVTQELERGRDVTVTCRCIPLFSNGAVDGGFILLRDISELKRRDRLLLSKDATIREIHHRVKNNLQTISSLLRIQARRVKSEEAISALNESVRRIASIAIVHETLANDFDDDASGDDAPFLDVARPLIRLIEEGLQSPENPIRFTLIGDAGRLPLIRSQPLAVVLTELLQNVVKHAFPVHLVPDEGRCATVSFRTEGNDLCVTVSDNGQGLPEGFQFAEAKGLGLTLVNIFVSTELGGTITMRRGDGPESNPGTITTVRFPRQWDDRVLGPTIGT